MNKDQVEFSVEEGLGSDVYKAELTFTEVVVISKDESIHIKFKENLEERVQQQMLTKMFSNVYGEQWLIQGEMATLCKRHMEYMHILKGRGAEGAEMTIKFLEILSVHMFNLKENSLP